jgi:hypothetical protein
MEGFNGSVVDWVVVWLSANYNLPSSFEHPRIEFASAKEMTSHFYESIARREQTPMVLNQPEIDVVSLYNNETKTIYLLDVAGMEKHPLSCPCWSTKWFITFKT